MLLLNGPDIHGCRVLFPHNRGLVSMTVLQVVAPTSGVGGSGGRLFSSVLMFVMFVMLMSVVSIAAGVAIIRIAIGWVDSAHRCLAGCRLVLYHRLLLSLLVRVVVLLVFDVHLVATELEEDFLDGRLLLQTRGRDRVRDC